MEQDVLTEAHKNHYQERTPTIALKIDFKVFNETRLPDIYLTVKCVCCWFSVRAAYTLIITLH